MNIEKKNNILSTYEGLYTCDSQTNKEMYYVWLVYHNILRKQLFYNVCS